MTTELKATKRSKKPSISRRVGGLIVTVTEEGVAIRAYRKRKSVRATWKQIVKLGLQNDRYALTAEQWDKPLDTLHKLARQPRV